MAAPAPAPPATQTMYSADGSPVEVPADKVVDVYKSGQLSFAKGQQVYLRRGSDTVALDGADAGALLSSEESKYYQGGSGAEFEDQELSREYGSVGGQAKALAAGAARGLSFGLSDLAASELGGDETRTELQRLQRYNPRASLLGETVGTLAPVVVSGGSSALARGVTSGVRGAAAVGAGVEAAAGRALVRAGAREGGYLARGVAGAAGQGAELAIYGAGSEVSREALANEQLSGEKILAAAGMHALLGGAVGGAMGAGGVAVGQLAHAGLDAGTRLAERATGRVVEREAATLGEKAGKIGETLLGDTSELATKKAIKSTGLNQPLMREAEALPKEVQETLARQVTEDYAKILGREPGAILSHVEQAEAAALVKKQAGERLGAAVDALDASGAPAALDVAGLAARARKEVVEPLKRLAGADGYAASVEKYLVDLEAKAPGMTFKEFHQNRGFLDDLLYEAGRTASPAKKALEKVRALMEDTFTTGAEAAAAKAGKKFAAEYKLLKQEYRAAAHGVDFTAKGAERDLANRTLGLSEQLGVLGGLAQGGLVGAVSGAAGAVMQNLTRKYGDQVAAQWLKRVASGSSWVEATGALVDQVIDKSVQGYFRRGIERVAEVGQRTGRQGLRLAEDLGADRLEEGERRRRGAKASSSEASGQEAEFKAARERVAALATSTAPTTVAARLPAGTPPAVAASSQATAQRAAAFLGSKLPAPVAQGQTLQPHLARYEVDPSTQQKFLQYVRAVDDPTSVLRDLERGRISAEGVEALKAVYPELYGDVRARVTAQVAQLREPLSYEQARELGVLLDVVAHPAMDPAFIAAIQGTFAPLPPAAPAAAPPVRPVNTARVYERTDDAA